MSNAQIAVCMPAYNCEKAIEKSIHSILSQSFSEFSFIITDDCSQDKTVEVIKNYKDKRILLFHNEKNLGAIATRNKMLEYCIVNGFKYMAIMDADDIAYPDRLKKQICILEQDPALAICGSSMKVQRTGGVWGAPQKPNQVKAQLIFGNQIPTSTATVRLRYMRQYNLRWEKEFAPCADYHLWYKMLFLHGLRAKNTGDVDMVYVYSPDGISRGSGLESQEQKDAAVKLLILSHFSIAASFEDAMGFMKVALYRSNSLDDAPGYVKIGRQLIANTEKCPVNYQVMRQGLHARTKSYFRKIDNLPQSIRLQFIESGLTNNMIEDLSNKVKKSLKKVKYEYLDIYTPNLSWALKRKYDDIIRFMKFQKK